MQRYKLTVNVAKKIMPKTYSVAVKELKSFTTQKFSQLDEDKTRVVSNVVRKIFKTAAQESLNNPVLEKVAEKFKIFQKIDGKNIFDQTLILEEYEHILKDIPLRKKISICFGIFLAVLIIQSLILVSLVKIGKLDKALDESLTKKIQSIITVIVAPITEEVARVYCEHLMSNGSIIFSTIVNIFEFTSYTTQLTKMGGTLKKAVILRLLTSGMHYLNGFLQEILMKRLGKKGIKVSLILTIILHGIWNAMSVKYQNIILKWLRT